MQLNVENDSNIVPMYCISSETYWNEEQIEIDKFGIHNQIFLIFFSVKNIWLGDQFL